MNRAFLGILFYYEHVQQYLHISEGTYKNNHGEDTKDTEKRKEGEQRVGRISTLCNYETSSINVHASMRHAKNSATPSESATDRASRISEVCVLFACVT